MKFEELKIGMTDSITKVITSDDINSFAEISLDKNPLHLDEEAASKGIFGRRVAHGILVSGLISAVLGTKLPGDGTIYRTLSGYYRQQFAAGDGQRKSRDLRKRIVPLF